MKLNLAAATVDWQRLWLSATYIVFMNSSLAALIDSLICTLACSLQTKRGAPWSHEMSRFRIYWRPVGKVKVAGNQVLMVKKGRMTRNSGSFFGWGGVGTSNSGFFGGWRRIQTLVFGFFG
jgi:hypothetical protein